MTRATGIKWLESRNPGRLLSNFEVRVESHRILTTVTASASVVHDWINNIVRLNAEHHFIGRLVVGLGVQWPPSVYPPPVAANLQLCVGHECLIFHLSYAADDQGVPDSLRYFLHDPKVIFVGLWNGCDNAMLWNSVHKLWIPRLVDLRLVACTRIGIDREISIQELAKLVLGIDGLQKKGWVGRSDWDIGLLIKAQIEYACVDAFLSLSMGLTLRVWDWLLLGLPIQYNSHHFG